MTARAAVILRQKFTQKERDNETGLDYFGARYFARVEPKRGQACDFAILSNPKDWIFAKDEPAIENPRLKFLVRRNSCI